MKKKEREEFHARKIIRRVIAHIRKQIEKKKVTREIYKKRKKRQFLNRKYTTTLSRMEDGLYVT